ncbi:MAG: hypothetical protein NUV63_13885, partial [Gallionella sp.]|nr:hypothetical protein [Gallionella sp.]
YGPKINGHSQIVAVCPTQNHGEDYDSQQVFANASLIAAAPDLLEKAQAVLVWWDAFIQTTKHDTQPECEDAEFREFNQLRAALAKATS